MQDIESFRLLHGPYHAPRCRRGELIFCELRGAEVVVGQINDGLIQWPCVKMKGRRSLILCGDLVKAVRQESVVAVSYYWGVATGTVTKWRRCLGVDPLNEGSLRLVRHYVRQAIVAAHQPEALEKQILPRKGRPARPDRKRMPHVNYFKPEEIALLGTDQDQVIAARLGRGAKVVEAKRRKLGIPAFGKRGTYKRPASWKQSVAERQKRAIANGTWSLRASVRQFTPDEIALLGTDTDAMIAKVLDRSLKTIQWKRKTLDIPSFTQSQRVHQY
jgi:hypothetical protein